MQKISFNLDWQFALAKPASVLWTEPPEADRQAVSLPHDWSIGLERAADNPSSNSGGYFPMGRGWYRKSFEAPEKWRGKKVFVEFEGVYMNAEVRLNENFLGRHPYG